MTASEANKIIAKYMDWKIKPEWLEQSHWLGLDDLVPVWEKLDICFKIEWLRYNGCIFYFERPNEIEIHHSCSHTDELNAAAVIATAKAIKAIKEGK